MTEIAITIATFANHTINMKLLICVRNNFEKIEKKIKGEDQIKPNIIITALSTSITCSDG